MLFIKIMKILIIGINFWEVKLLQMFCIKYKLS